jgi:uncharacterized protein YecE (DUF72 family)
MKKERSLYVGTSGFYYSQWKNTLYKGAPAAQWLAEYAKIFNSVELNGTFYRVPRLTTLQSQAAKTPGDFKFSAKVSRYITHILRLNNCRDKINEFTDLLQNGFGEKLEKLLFQMPPSFHYSEEKLEMIEKNINDSPLNVIEFRHISWWNEVVFKFFREHRYVFCNVDFPGLQPPFADTGKHFYLRLHGVPQLFKSVYTDERLREIAADIPGSCSVYCIYFNNTYYDYAHENARILRAMLGARK